MKISKRIVSCVLILGLFLTACGLEEPVSDSAKLLQESIYNVYNFKSFKYKADLKTKTVDKDTKKKKLIDLTVNGAVSKQVPSKSGTEFTMVAKVEDNKENYRFDLSTKLFSEDIYLKLLALPEIPNFPVNGLKGLVGKWWKIGSSDLATVDAVQKIEEVSVSYDDLDEKGKQKRDLILTANFFKDIDYKATETLEGLNVYKYNFVVNGAGVYKYIYDLAKIDGQEKKPNLKNIKKTLNDIFITGTIFIDAESKTMVKIVLQLDPKKSKNSNFDSIDFSMNLSDLDKPFGVETPTDFEIFDLGKFLGSFLASDS